LTPFTGAKTLPPNQDIAIQIQYRPLGADLDRGVIQQIAFPYTSRSCKDTLRAQIQAASYIPRVSLAPAIVDLGIVLACDAVVDTVIEVSNTSLIPVTVTNVVGNGLQYTGGAVIVPAKSMKSIPVRVAPAVQDGPFVVTATVQYGPCGFTDSITFTGTLLRPQYSTSLQRIDFSTILLCDTTRTVSRMITLSASGLMGLRSRLQSIDIAQPFSTDIVAGSSLTDTLSVMVTFQPPSVGTYTDTLRVVVGPCSTAVDVVLTGICATKDRSVSVSSGTFGIVGPGQFKDEQITITNTGSAPIELASLTGVRAPFSIVASTPVLPATLLPAERAVVTIRYTNTGFARRDTIRVQTVSLAPCADTQNIQMIASTPPKDTLRGLQVIAPPDVVVRAGDDVDLPLQLTSPKPLDSAGIYSLTIDVSFDPRLFKLESVPQSPALSQISANETSPGKIRIQIAATNPITAANPLITLRGSTYVGPTRSTALVVDTAFASGVVIDGVDGKLTVVPDCDIDASTIGVGRPVVVSVTYQDANEVRLRYTVLSDEVTSMDVVNLSGRSVPMMLSSVRPGVHEITMPTDALESGVYTVVFRNGRHVRTTAFIISR
jgi:hypothetical protein